MNVPNLMADHQKMVQRIRDLERVVARLEALADTIEEKRGPGRPRKAEAA